MSSEVSVPTSPRLAIRGSTLGPEKSEPKANRLENLTALVAKLALAEFLVASATAYATSLLYYRLAFEQWVPSWAYGGSALSIAALILLISFGFRHYTSLQTQPRDRFLWRGLGAVALAFSFFLSALFLLKATEDYSRATFFFQLAAVTFAVVSTRTIGHSAIASAIAAGRVQARRAVLIGNKAGYSDIIGRLNQAGVQTVRSFPFPGRPQSTLNGDGIGLDGELVRQMITACRAVDPDDVIIIATATELPRLARLADALSELPVSVHMVPVESGALLSSARLGEVGLLTTIQLLQAPLSVFDRIVKRAFDVTTAVSGLVLLSPLLLAVSVAIKLDSRGPILFRQTRHGYNNKSIRVFKFRSMSTTEDGQAFRQAIRNDPRVTRLGRLLRRTNIDELPQLLNVLLGEMSVVGPRPHPIALNKMFEQYISPLSRRHNVKPGITGWAQVNGCRGETDTLEKMQRRFEYDLYYIDNWSFLLDIKIIVMTLFSKAAYANAY